MVPPSCRTKLSCHSLPCSCDHNSDLSSPRPPRKLHSPRSNVWDKGGCIVRASWSTVCCIEVDRAFRIAYRKQERFYLTSRDDRIWHKCGHTAILVCSIRCSPLFSILQCTRVRKGLPSSAFLKSLSLATFVSFDGCFW